MYFIDEHSGTYFKTKAIVDSINARIETIKAKIAIIFLEIQLERDTET